MKTFGTLSTGICRPGWVFTFFFSYCVGMIVGFALLRYSEVPSIAETVGIKVTYLSRICQDASRPEGSTITFLEALEPLDHSAEPSNAEREEFLQSVLPFAIAPPYPAINETCLPHPILDPSTIECSRFPGAFSGKRSTPAQIGHFMKFSFESDVLEAQIHESGDIISKFFIIEATRSNSDHSLKPLALDQLLGQQRFARFKDKIVHFILDDSMPAEAGFGWEDFHEKARWEKFLVWNANNHVFKDTDVLIFGDCDEIPSREVIQYFQHCTMDGPIDIGTSMTNSDVHTAFRTDWPIPGHPYLWGSPTAFTLKQASELANRYPTRTRGRSGRSVWGGMHLTYYGYLPFYILKLLTVTDRGSISTFHNPLREIVEGLKRGDSVGTIWKRQRDWMRVHWGDGRDRDLGDNLEGEGRVIPWFIKCNPDRYQYFYRTDGVEDPRITQPLRRW
jgi:hypothetical protein